MQDNRARLRDGDIHFDIFKHDCVIQFASCLPRVSQMIRVITCKSGKLRTKRIVSHWEGSHDPDFEQRRHSFSKLRGFAFMEDDRLRIWDSRVGDAAFYQSLISLVERDPQYHQLDVELYCSFCGRPCAELIEGNRHRFNHEFCCSRLEANRS